MRLRKNKLRLMMYACGAALVTLSLSLAVNMIPKAFASEETFVDIDTAAPDDNPTGSYEEEAEHFVTIHDQGNSLQIKTSAITVREVLERAEIEYAESDKVEPSLTSRIDTDDYHINIYRSRPVMIIDGIVKKRLMTASYDPKTIAGDANLTVYDGDTIERVDNSNFLEVGDLTTYKITRNGGRTITLEDTIPYSEETVQDSSLASGEKEVRTAGEDGRKEIKYRVNFVDGVEVSRELISETVVREPVNRVVAVGSKKSIAPEWAQCEKYARAAGVSDNDMYDALTLIYHESGCRVDATNAYSGAYGIPQALPGEKMAAFGSDWKTNPVTQIKWMIDYVNRRYGGWKQALEFWYCTGTCKGITKNSTWY
ncbi:G5 domain-containing protein [Candidatus Saccharibacteria bacterium]|nr:G5 domain-containing protein [Candidatus Saccharibacteria bacterium]